MNEGLVSTWKQGKVRLARGQDAGEFIPTWQVGQEQFRPSNTDPFTFAQNGYDQHSLVYMCVKEKATSFAALKTQVIRRDGSVVDGHRMTQLLDNPNSYQDGQEFAELLKSQFEIAGNAYIRKIRQSDDPDRRRDFALFPVQELELIRPDYVTIDPGPRRYLDQFIIRVQGQEVARFPRRDIIHIKEPSLTNDFYGTPKLARLTREASVDLSMSDFELAFFRNAGVPMGLLSVKGNMSPDETKTVKRRFRQAYNGVRKWFDLLVLNADQATYTPMGLKQSDMEMDGTRFHGEARICGTFGVPGQLVGARYALQMNSGLEEAEHQFWAETMVPDAMRIARAWQKFLLPDFAVQADRGAVVSYDFTQVRALQEDKSRKLREVVRMILTGGFTVNQALATVGLPTIPDGDFYIRNGNHVVVGSDGTMTPMAPSQQGGGGPNLDNPLEGAARRQIEQVLERIGA